MKARLHATCGQRGWVDATFSAGFLSLSAFLIWPAFAIPMSPLGQLRMLLLLLLPFGCIGPQWGPRMRRRVTLAFTFLWVGALAEFTPSGHQTSVVFQGAFFIALTLLTDPNDEDNEMTPDSKYGIQSPLV